MYIIHTYSQYIHIIPAIPTYLYLLGTRLPDLFLALGAYLS